MAYLGDFKNSVGVASLGVHALFTTVKACGVPVALVSGAARTIKNGLASGLHSTGVTLTQSAGSITGLNKIVVLTSAALYTTGNYDVILSTGSVNGINVRGYLVGSFSIQSRSNPTATGVWAVTARTLTSGGNVATSVWAAATRTLTSGANAASSVWAYTAGAGRQLTTSGNTAVWAAGTRTLTSGSTVASSVWAAATRTLTSGGATSTSVWAATTRTLTSGANAASSVWAYTAGAGRQLTTSGNTAVWNSGTRTLTSGATVASSVWAAAARTLTSGGAVWDATVNEIAAIPAASPAADQAMALVYQAIRNTRITTTGSDKIHTSATALVGTAAVSYVSGTKTFTKGKYI